MIIVLLQTYAVVGLIVALLTVVGLWLASIHVGYHYKPPVYVVASIALLWPYFIVYMFNGARRNL